LGKGRGVRKRQENVGGEGVFERADAGGGQNCCATRGGGEKGERKKGKKKKKQLIRMKIEKKSLILRARKKTFCTSSGKRVQTFKAVISAGNKGQISTEGGKNKKNEKERKECPGGTPSRV